MSAPRSGSVALLLFALACGHEPGTTSAHSSGQVTGASTSETGGAATSTGETGTSTGETGTSTGETGTSTGDLGPTVELLDAVCTGDHPQSECVDYEYDGAGTLTIHHVDVPLNCCPMFDLAVEASDQALTISVIEGFGPCDCGCLFTLTYRVIDLPVGIYEVTIDAPRLDVEPPLTATLDLATTPIGGFCRP